MSGPENRENSANQPVWRRAPPDKLRRNTGVFPAVPGFKIADIADALLEQGYADILSIQVSAQTKVTFSDSQTLQRLCDNNFILGKETVFVLPFYSNSPNQDKQASEPALSTSDVDTRQKQDTLERLQDSALDESQRVDSSSESEDTCCTAQSRCDEDRANRIIADASSYELAIETAIQSEIVRERSRMHANPTGRDCAVPKEAAITDSTSTSTANADTTAPAPTTVNSQKTRSTSRLAVPVPPKQKNKVSRPSRTPKTT